MTALSPWNIAPTEHGAWLRTLSDYARRPLLGTGYIAGGVPSNAADATNDIAFTTGACVSTNGYLFPIPAFTKRIDATFAGGTAAGGLAAGLSISATTFFAHALWGPNTRNADIGFDTSLTAANLLADAAAIKLGLTEYRRIFAFRNSGSANQVFSAVEINGGGLLVQIAPAIDFTKDWGGADDTAQTGTSTIIPVGVQMFGEWSVTFADDSFAAASILLFSSFDVADTTPVLDSSNPHTTQIGDVKLTSDGVEAIFPIRCLTRASDAAVRYRVTASTVDHSLGAMLKQWIDFRVS